MVENNDGNMAFMFNSSFSCFSLLIGPHRSDFFLSYMFHSCYFYFYTYLSFSGKCKNMKLFYLNFWHFHKVFFMCKMAIKAGGGKHTSCLVNLLQLLAYWDIESLIQKGTSYKFKPAVLTFLWVSCAGEVRVRLLNAVHSVTFRFQIWNLTDGSPLS